MGRLLAFLELAAISCGIAFFSLWGSLPARLAVTPLVITLLCPCIAACAVWPIKTIGKAFLEGWGNNPFRKPVASSREIWRFLEKMAPLAGACGCLIFLVMALAGRSGSAGAKVGLCAMEAGAVFLIFQSVRQTVESLQRRETLPPASLIPQKALERFSISPREGEVAQLLLDGLRYGEIAGKLFISMKTVKTHVHRLYEKTGTRNRMELANRLLS